MEQSQVTTTKPASLTMMSVFTGIFAIGIGAIVLHTLVSSPSVLGKFIALLIVGVFLSSLAIAAITLRNRR
ncbi:MAG: hypothetical protein KC496_06605 [Anaerolineae bacterium]|nr:hypothetical protein [Anaerolineae bacterium]